MTLSTYNKKDLYGQQEIGKEHVDNNAAVTKTCSCNEVLFLNNFHP